jgi:hypothetical protein
MLSLIEIKHIILYLKNQASKEGTMEGEHSDLATSAARVWPSQWKLPALTLVVDHMQRESGGNVSQAHLLARLEQLEPFGAKAGRWLATASARHLIVPFQETAREALISLNRRHIIARKALLIRERVLSTLEVLQGERENGQVPFSRLERELQTCRLCTGEQRVRQAWLELLVALGALQAQKLPQPDGPFVTTMLALNPEAPVIAIPRQQRQRNQVRLIVACDNYLKRKGYSWTADFTLVRRLTGRITGAEARAALSRAAEEGIARLEAREDIGSERQITEVHLRPEHERVRGSLELRDQLISLTEQALRRRPRGVSEAVLVEEFWTEAQLGEDESWFWLRLLEEERVLQVSSLQLSGGERARVVDLRLGDRLISQVRQHVRK